MDEQLCSSHATLHAPARPLGFHLSGCDRALAACRSGQASHVASIHMALIGESRRLPPWYCSAYNSIPQTVGDRTDRVELNINQSLARRLSLPRCPNLFTHNEDLEDIVLKIHVQDSISHGWLPRVVSSLVTSERSLTNLNDLSIDFVIDVHLSHGNIVPKGLECEGCALHPELPLSLSGPGVLDDIMAKLKTICDVLDCDLVNNPRIIPPPFQLSVNIRICCCAQLDPCIWMPRLEAWFPKSRTSGVLNDFGFINSTRILNMGLWCMHCGKSLRNRGHKEST